MNLGKPTELTTAAFADGVADGIVHIMSLDSLPHRVRGGCAIEYDEPGDFSEHRKFGNAMRRAPGLFDGVLGRIGHRVVTGDVSKRRTSRNTIRPAEELLLLCLR